MQKQFAEYLGRIVNMKVTKNKVYPKFGDEKEKMSKMARLFRLLVKICFYPVVIDENKRKIKFKYLSTKFFLYNILYFLLPTITTFVVTMTYFDIDFYLSSLIGAFNEMEATDAVSIMGYGFAVTNILYGFYLLIFKSFGKYKTTVKQNDTFQPP